MSREKQIEEMARVISEYHEAWKHGGGDWKTGLAEALYNAGYRKQEWISVDEKLPEKYTRVLCYFKYEPESPNVICENLYLGSKLWLSDGSKVTHWMMFPELPKMKGE